MSVWWPGSRTGSSPPWWSPPPLQGLLDTPSSALSHLLRPPAPDWQWRSALIERHKGQIVPERSSVQGSENTTEINASWHHNRKTYRWATSWTAISSQFCGLVPAGKSSSLVTMVTKQLSTDWLSSCDLTSCVNSPLTFPSNSWNRPPRRPSTAAAERVNTCTNYREGGIPVVLQYYYSTVNTCPNNSSYFRTVSLLESMS